MNLLNNKVSEFNVEGHRYAGGDSCGASIELMRLASSGMLPWSTFPVPFKFITTLTGPGAAALVPQPAV